MEPECQVEYMSEQPTWKVGCLGFLGTRWLKNLDPDLRTAFYALWKQAPFTACDKCGTIPTLNALNLDASEIRAMSYWCCGTTRARPAVAPQGIKRQLRAKMQNDRETRWFFVCQSCGFTNQDPDDYSVFYHMLEHEALPPEYGYVGYTIEGLSELSYKFGRMPLENPNDEYYFTKTIENAKKTVKNKPRLTKDSPWLRNIPASLWGYLINRAVLFKNLLVAPTGYFFSRIQGVCKNEAMAFVYHLESSDGEGSNIR